MRPRDNGLHFTLRTEQIERALAAASNGIVLLDKAGTYIYANAAAERIFGVPRRVILQRNFSQAEWKQSTLRGDPFPEEETPFKRVFRDNVCVYALKTVIERPDGERVVIATNAAPLYDRAGHFDGIVGILTDVTEQQARISSWPFTIPWPTICADR